MALVIGLTGGIASGKSTVAQMFKEFNIPVVDADVIAREVVEPDQDAYEEIIKAFGEDILQADRTLDRKKLGAIIFNDAEKRKNLNQIVHPAIRKEMVARRDGYLADGASCVVMDIPLLFENDLTHFVEKTIVVYVDEMTQKQRLMERDNYTEEEAIARMKSQMPLKEKAALADAIIDNNESVEHSFKQLKDLLHQWNAFSKA